ncbi:putative leucine-rich repeat-containing, plant-type, leucine-rich repeat domain superfamily [Helianthus debilis subsp. tardiflorus]
MNKKEMASSLITTTSTALFSFLILYLAVSFNNIAAKHRHSTTTKHHTHHRNATGASNPRLEQAYHALQAWKRVIYSDPFNTTSDWTGPSVCSYTGVYCAPFPNDTDIITVAGIDLNHADIAGFLPNEIGLLSDLALIHLNSNRFCGILPQTLSNLSLLYELDLSNNRFVGPFPSVVLSLPNLKYLDLRYNEFEGALPPELFNKSLDAIFINNNRLTSRGMVSDDRRNCLLEKPLQRSKKECDAVLEHPVDCFEHPCGEHKHAEENHPKMHRT